MQETLSVLPFSFWVVMLLLAGGAWVAFRRIQSGLGIPVLMVLFTTAVWYVGDAYYNDYLHHHHDQFPAGTLDAAWWQVAVFLAVFLAVVTPLHRLVNARYLRRTSLVGRYLAVGYPPEGFEINLRRLFWGCTVVWLLLSLIAIVRLREEVVYYFFPFLAYKADPWGRGQIGGGFSALLSLAGYLHGFTAACFGLVAALTHTPSLRRWALAMCAFTWPYFIFDRTRNAMLAVALPAILGYVFLRLRQSLVIKMLVLSACFLGINVWFKFVIETRSQTTIPQAFREKSGKSLRASDNTRHEGLNMFEELCWINYLMNSGAYTPNWGSRYLAELANPVPRGLWPDKPTIGLDYAVARGQETTETGTTATVSTGMIGQGVVNFGTILGPATTALLLALWAAVLGRMDLHGDAVGRLPLYLVGLVLTFNLGRDITFLTLYTFVFGWAVVWAVEKYGSQRPVKQKVTKRMKWNQHGGTETQGAGRGRDLTEEATKARKRIG